MKKYIAIIILLIAVTAYAFPPTPPTVNITGNAATATALASNPTDCGANTVATAIDASGNLTCSQSVGTIATQNADSVNIDGGAIDGTAIGANSASTGAFTTLSATGQIKGVPSATAPIMFGNTTPVNTSTGATFPTAVKTQISKASAFTNAAVGDLIIVTGGTGATTGQYRLTTKTSNDLVVVDRNIHASGTDITDGEFTVYKDVVTVSPTDGTNGQMISGWSHNYRPLQIGGSTLAATSHQLSSKDVIFGGSVEFESNAYFDASLSTINGLYFYYLNTGNNIGVIQGYPVDDGLKIALNTEDGKGNNNLIITTFANGAKDHDHETASANPTLFIHSNTNPDSDNTQWLSFTHDTADGVINTGLGGVRVQPAQITAGSGTGITVNTNGNIAQQVYKVTTTYAAYSDSDLTKGIVIATLPAKTRLVAAYADTTVAYAGTDITAVTLEVGITAEGATEILATGNVFAGAILLGDADAEMGTGMTRAAKEQGAYMPSFTGTTAIYATIDATTGAATTLANLTAGSTTFYLITERLP
jgi:hypothetical protein